MDIYTSVYKGRGRIIMSSVNPIPSSWFRPWTLYNNSFTRFPRDLVKSLPLDKAVGLTQSFAKVSQPVWDNRPVRFVASVITFGYSNPFTRFIDG